MKELSSSNLKKNEFDKFKYLVFKVFEAHSPVKEKYIRYNQGSFMTNDLRKAIMNRSPLFNKFRKKIQTKINGLIKYKKIFV